MTAKEKKQALLLQKAEEMKKRVAEMMTSPPVFNFEKSSPEKHVVVKKEEATDIDEIGGEQFKLWGKNVQVLGWEKKRESVKVLVNGEKSIYNWPLHKLCAYHTAIHFEAEPRYMKMFGNSRKITIGNDAYIVANDKVWYKNGTPIDKDHELIAAKWSEFVVGKEVKSDIPWII
jgi:hypothetical protein